MVRNRSMKDNSEVEDFHRLNPSLLYSNKSYLLRERLNPGRSEDQVNLAGLHTVSYCPFFPWHCILSPQTGFLISLVTWQRWLTLDLQVHMLKLQLSPEFSFKFLERECDWTSPWLCNQWNQGSRSPAQPNSQSPFLRHSADIWEGSSQRKRL